MAGECAIEYQSLSKIPGPSAAAGGTQAAGGAAAAGGDPATPGPLSPMAVPLWADPRIQTSCGSSPSTHPGSDYRPRLAAHLRRSTRAVSAAARAPAGIEDPGHAG